jgi:2-polyprenyl-3-methyl-5-hydroxy-6-metoxy-1,4-benzoquinol methylase
MSDGGEAKRKKLVGILRGYFASPVIAEKMLAGYFSVTDRKSIPRPDILTALFQYLHSIGILRKGTVGEYALNRSRPDRSRQEQGILIAPVIFRLLPYFQQLPSFLAGTGKKPSVNRLRSVRGNGQLHSKKFFPAAFGFFQEDPPKAIIDIGCGDGCFLESARERWPDVAVFGVDLSESALETTKKRLTTSGCSESIAVTAKR